MMLIFLDDDLTALDLNDNDSLAVLVEILMAHLRGFHYVVASKRLCDYLSSRDVGAPAKRAIATMRNQLSNEYLFEKVECYLRITMDSNAIGKVEIKKSIDFFYGVQFSKSIILAEDSRDAELYNYAADQYMAKNKIRGVSISAIPRHGGGEETPNVFQRSIQESNSPILCITDSDFYFNGDTCSAKSIKCDGIVESIVSKFPIKHFVLSVREIENLIPIRLMNELDVDADNVDKLGNFHDKNHLAYKYVDLKYGVSKCWICKNSSNVKFKEFWIPVISCLIGSQDLCQGDVTKVCGENLLIIPAAKERLTESLLSFFKSCSPHKALEGMDHGDQGAEWLGIGKSVFSWGLARRAI